MSGVALIAACAVSFFGGGAMVGGVLLQVVRDALRDRDAWRENARVATARQDQLEDQLRRYERTGMTDLLEVAEVAQAHGLFAGVRALRRARR